MSYILVNPMVQGKFNNKFSGKNPLTAANNAYKALSKYFSNNIPKFHFTLQKTSRKGQIGGGKNSDYHHFKVTEKKKGKSVTFDLNKHNSINNAALKKFRTRVAKIQSGGKKDDDSSSSSDSYSDSSDYKHKKRYTTSQPISYYYYDPYLYRLNKYYVPTFTTYTTPYIEIPLYF